jgi:hypothetical protein
MREGDDLLGTSTGTVRYPHDPADDAKPSERVVRSVAALTDTDPVDLPPLYDAIDPEALDRLVDSQADSECEIAFQYAGTEVYFSEPGDLHVTSFE